MANNKQALAQIQVECSDRARTFALNNEAFCVLEEHFQKETKNESYNIYTDFPWDSNINAKNMNLVMWAGFFTDAKKDKELWTVEKAKEVVDFLSVHKCGALINEAVERALKIKDDVKKKVPQRSTVKKRKKT